MTVNELLAKLAAGFPAFNSRALEALAPVFRVRLEKHEGPALANAYVETIGGFTVKASKALFPMPADFADRLPSGGMSLPKGDGPKLDFKARNDRAVRLFAEWRAGQGERGAKGIPEVMRALEDIARPLSLIEAWKPDPKPLVLRPKDLRTAQHRALSLERRRRWGAPGHVADLWWQQISTIAEQWRIPTKREEWEEATSQRMAA